MSHGRLGKTVWPCASHWRELLENSSDDEFILTTGIEYAATQFEKKVGMRRLSRSKKTEPKAKRCLVGSLNKDDAGKVTGKVGGTHDTRGGEEKGSVSDMFQDSPETIGPSDEEISDEPGFCLALNFFENFDLSDWFSVLRYVPSRKRCSKGPVQS